MANSTAMSFLWRTDEVGNRKFWPPEFRIDPRGPMTP